MTIQAFRIIESTLREGEQFASAHFTPSQKIAIAEMLDEFGVEYLELTSPCASPQSEADLRTVAALPLQAKVLTHVRCHMDDARVAVDIRIDPGLLGGMIVKVGSRMVDASLNSRLQRLRLAMRGVG